MRPTANRFSSLADFALKTTSASEWMTAHLTQPDSPVSTNYQSSCRRDMAIVAKQRLPETIRVECEAKGEKQLKALTFGELSESKGREMQRTGSRRETRQHRSFRGVVTAGNEHKRRTNGHSPEMGCKMRDGDTIHNYPRRALSLRFPRDCRRSNGIS